MRKVQGRKGVEHLWPRKITCLYRVIGPFQTSVMQGCDWFLQNPCKNEALPFTLNTVLYT